LTMVFIFYVGITNKCWINVLSAHFFTVNLTAKM
jgi:hypothetical protein